MNHVRLSLVKHLIDHHVNEAGVVKCKMNVGQFTVFMRKWLYDRLQF